MCKQKVTDSVQSAADSQSVQSVTGRRSRSQISSLFLFIHQISDLTEVCYSCGFIKRSGHRVPRWLLVHSNESCSPGSHATDVFVLFQPRGLTSCRITAHMNGMKICFTFLFNLKGSDNTKKITSECVWRLLFYSHLFCNDLSVWWSAVPAVATTLKSPHRLELFLGGG